MIRCLQRIKQHVEESGLNIPFERLKQMAWQLEREKAGSLGPDEFKARAQELIKAEYERYAALKRHEDAQVIRHREDTLNKVLDTSKKHVYENILDWTSANSAMPTWGSNLDVQDVRNAIESRLMSEFRLASRPFVDKVAGGESDLNTMREMFAIARLEPLGKTNDAVALEYAKVIHGMYNSIFNLKKAFNPTLERLPEYIQKGMHEREKVSAADKADWVAQAIETYGARSFPEASDAELPVILGNIYDRIVSGDYGSVVDDSQADKFITLKSMGANIIKRQNRQRKLIPNDADSLYKYNLQFGHGNLFETMEKVIRDAANDVAQMMKFSVNPQAVQEGVLARAKSKASPEERKLLDQNEAAIRKSFATANRQIDVPAQNAAATATKIALTAQYIAKAMHGVVKAQMDLANAAALMRGMNGDGVLTNAAKIATAYYTNMAKIVAGRGEIVREAVEPLWLLSASARTALIDQLGGTAMERGNLTKLSNFASLVSGHYAHVDAFNHAIGVMIGNHLGKMADTPYANLPGHMQTWLGRYEIGEGEWNVIRTAVEPWDDHENGIPAERRKMIDATGIAAIPDEVIADYLRSKAINKARAKLPNGFTNTADLAAIEEAASNVAEPDDQAIFLARKELEFKVGALINENTRLSVVRPGTKQRALMYQGKDVNDPIGMALRLAMQFKGAAITQFDTVKRGYYSGEGGRGEWRTVAAHIALLMFITAITETLDALMNGKTPENPGTFDFAMQVAKKSGAAGLYSDVLLSVADRARKSRDMSSLIEEVGSQTLGPTVTDSLGLGLSAYEFGQHAVGAGDERLFKDAKKRFARTTLGLVPLHNLFYSSAAFNYYVANGFKEFMSSGYLSHLEAGVESRPGLLEPRQRYFAGKPTESPRWMHSLLGQ